jgi:GNAT superfamily N-acetyltransferase
MIQTATDADVAPVVDLVNRVYADAERGLWRDGAQRTDRTEIEAVVRAGELVVARLGDRIVGVVRVRRLDEHVGEFGMLVTDPEHRGTGIGRRLVAHAERWARRQGLELMQLELLVPRTWAHPVKEFLRGWYQRLGYRPVRTERLDAAHPALPPRLATPCDFLVFQKALGDVPGR